MNKSEKLYNKLLNAKALRVDGYLTEAYEGEEDGTLEIEFSDEETDCLGTIFISLEDLENAEERVNYITTDGMFEDAEGTFKIKVL
jgi:hypothetical protein